MHIFEFEKFSFKSLQTWLSSDYNWTISIYPCTLYLAFVILGIKYMKEKSPFQLRKQLIVWNTLQATISFVISVRIFPELFIQIVNRDFHSTFCTA